MKKQLFTPFKQNNLHLGKSVIRIRWIIFTFKIFFLPAQKILLMFVQIRLICRHISCLFRKHEISHQRSYYIYPSFGTSRSFWSRKYLRMSLKLESCVIKKRCEFSRNQSVRDFAFSRQTLAIAPAVRCSLLVSVLRKSRTLLREVRSFLLRPTSIALILFIPAFAWRESARTRSVRSAIFAR